MRSNKEEPAKKAKLAIGYITCGILMMVWSVIWLIYLVSDWNVSGTVYLAWGVILSGLSLAIIGLRVGQIDKSANQEDHQRDLEEKAMEKNPPVVLNRALPLDQPASTTETHDYLLDSPQGQRAPRPGAG